MSLFSELKRRKVYRVAAIYIIVGWVVLQVVDLFMSFMPLPEWTSRLVFVLLSAGFPIALVFAWAVELTPSGIRFESSEKPTSVPRQSRGDYIIYAAVVIVIAIGTWNLDWWQEPVDEQAIKIRSLVVLPLDNLMNDPEQTYFVGGMHEALIMELSKIEALRVISRTSAKKYLDSGKTVPEIGQELGVDAVIEGSVLRVGNTVRVTVQLIDAQTDRHLWSANFDRELTDVLALYADITRQIVDQVRVEITPEEATRLASTHVVDADAYELYLKGRYFCDKWGPQEMLQGIDLMRRAVAADPGSVLALAGLGTCLQYAAFFDYVGTLEILEEANQVTEQAIGLDGGSAEAWASYAGTRYYLNFDLATARLALEQALSINPSHLRSLVHYSWQLGEAGEFDAALKLAKRAISLDPLVAVVRTTLAQAYYLNGDFEIALTEWQRILDMDRGDPSFHYYVAWVYEQKSEFEKAIELHKRAIELSNGEPLYISGLGYSYGLAGHDGRAQLVLDQLLDQQAEGLAEPYHVAMVYIGLGNNELAIDWLEKAFVARNSQMLYIKQGAQFDSLREIPRFNKLIAKMGW